MKRRIYGAVILVICLLTVLCSLSLCSGASDAQPHSEESTDISQSAEHFAAAIPQNTMQEVTRPEPQKTEQTADLPACAGAQTGISRTAHAQCADNARPSGVIPTLLCRFTSREGDG